MNATLAGWLDYDLAQVGLGGMKLSQLVAGSGAALVEAVAVYGKRPLPFARK